MPETHSPRFLATADKGGAALFIYDAVGGSPFGGIRPKDVVDALEGFKQHGATILNVYINSPGGSVFDGMAIFNAIRRWEGEKVVHVDGVAASIASVIAMAGDRICMAPNALMMIHSASGGCIGTATDMRKVAEGLDLIGATMVDTYAKRTGQEAATLQAWLDAETWMDAKTCKVRGFADEIDEEENDETEGDDNGPAESLARAVAQFKHAPPEALRLLSLPLPTASARKPSPKEPPMAEPTAVNVTLDTKVFEARFTALTERAEAAEKVQGELLAVTGKATAGEALAMVAGLKERVAKADELVVRLAKLEAEKRAAQITTLLNTAAREGRLTPAKREELMKADGPAFARDPLQLKAFLDCLPAVVVPASAPKHQEPTQDPQAGLTEEEKQFAAQLKLDPSKVVAFKAEKK